MARIKAFRMKRRFTVVSLTGGYCELNCSHCSARYIRSMLPAPGPRLPRLLEALARRGVRGVLVSGGWTRDAVLPVEEHLDTLLEAKKKHSLVYNVHLGLETRRHILERAAGVFDLVDYEYTENRWMANKVRRVPGGVQRYRKALEAMLDAGLHVVPHIFLWHPHRDPERELVNEMKTLADLGLEEVNLLVYIPPSGDIDQATAEKLPHLLRLARTTWPGKLYLGCMRPPTARRILDEVAIEEQLVDRIANPSLKATRKHRDKLEFYDACCSIPENLLPPFKE